MVRTASRGRTFLSSVTAKTKLRPKQPAGGQRASWPTGQGRVVGGYNRRSRSAQILPSKINGAAGRERREFMKYPAAKAAGYFMNEPKRQGEFEGGGYPRDKSPVETLVHNSNRHRRAGDKFTADSGARHQDMVKQGGFVIFHADAAVRALHPGGLAIAGVAVDAEAVAADFAIKCQPNGAKDMAGLAVFIDLIGLWVCPLGLGIRGR